jgi:hypothetical protein
LTLFGFAPMRPRFLFFQGTLGKVRGKFADSLPEAGRKPMTENTLLITKREAEVILEILGHFSMLTREQQALREKIKHDLGE